VWRGFSELTRKDWQREKARQLFQFLITRKGVPMHREEIAFELWGIDDPNVAERDFKVALNVLSQALEPNKAGRGTTVFIERDGANYQLICHPILVIDKEVFEERVKLALSLPKSKQLKSLRQALELYQGEFLPDAKYESWSENERVRLKTLFLKTGLAYGEAALYASEFDEAVAVAERMVETDASFEPAYVLLMKAHARLYRKSMVVQTFRRCQDTLRREFGVDVMPTTVAVYKTLVGNSSL
jgi:LuxR family transcriptional regulator, maltose regulon positive regulatory protein